MKRTFLYVACAICLSSCAKDISSTQAQVYLRYWEPAFDNTEFVYIEIPNLITETSRNTLLYFHLKTAGGKLYLCTEASLGSRTVCELIYDNGSITTNYNAMLIDIIDFDIDGDSIKETLCLEHIYTYTAQGCPFSILVEEHGLKEYYNTFDLPVSNIGLQFSEEGDSLYINTITLDALALQRKYKVTIEKGQIILTNGNEKVGHSETEGP